MVLSYSSSLNHTARSSLSKSTTSSICPSPFAFQDLSGSFLLTAGARRASFLLLSSPHSRHSACFSSSPSPTEKWHLLSLTCPNLLCGFLGGSVLLSWTVAMEDWSTPFFEPCVVAIGASFSPFPSPFPAPCSFSGTHL